MIFLLIHKSYLVNYRFVKIMSYDHVVLVDGTKIPISQGKKRADKKRIHEDRGKIMDKIWYILIT